MIFAIAALRKAYLRVSRHQNNSCGRLASLEYVSQFALHSSHVLDRLIIASGFCQTEYLFSRFNFSGSKAWQRTNLFCHHLGLDTVHQIGID